MDDSIREFTEALAEARSKGEGTESVGDIEEDGDDDEPEDLLGDMSDYSVPEFEIMESSLQFMNSIKSIMKTCLDLMTEVANSVYEVTAEHDPVRLLCSSWANDVVQSVSELQEALTDVGAELYHPINLSKVRVHKARVIDISQKLGTKLICPPGYASIEAAGRLDIIDKYNVGVSSVRATVDSLGVVLMMS